MTIFKTFIFIFSMTLLYSCGEITGGSTGANIFNGVKDSIGGLSAVEIGNSTYLFEGVASNGGNASHLYSLSFHLPQNESITFVVHGNRTLTSGGHFIFTRHNGDVSLKIILNSKEHILPLLLTTQNELIEIDIDFHNDHTDTHILMWEKNGNHEDAEGCSFNRGCLYNSEDYALDIWLGVGKASGSYWGFMGRRELIQSMQGPLPARSNI